MLVLVNYAPPWWPLGRDAGVFGYAGRALLEGRAPYRDVWDHKPPGIYLADAIVLAGGAEPRWTLWLLSVAVAAAAALLASLVLRRAFGVVWGSAVAALHALVLADPRVYQYNDFAELFGLVLQWLMLWLLARGARRPWLAGAAAGTALIFKPTCGALALSVPALLLWRAMRAGGEGRRASAYVAGAAAFLGGAALPPIGVIAWLAYLGVLADAWDAVIVFNAAYGTGDIAWRLGLAAAECLYRIPVALLGVPAAASLFLRRQAPSRAAADLALLALLALPIEILFLALPGRFYGHYFLTLLPVLAVRAAAFFCAAEARLAWVAMRRRTLAAAAVVLGILQLDVSLVLGHRNRRGERLWERVALREVSARTAPAQAVLVWGAELGINLISGRRTPSVFGYVYPLFTPGYTTDLHWQRFLADLRRDPPALIVDGAFRTSPPTPVPMLDLILADPAAPMPAFARTALIELLRGYRREVTREGVIVWIKAADDGSSAA